MTLIDQDEAVRVAGQKSARLPHQSDFDRGYACGRDDAAAALRVLPASPETLIEAAVFEIVAAWNERLRSAAKEILDMFETRPDIRALIGVKECLILDRLNAAVAAAPPPPED